jgi:probable O-glycosylation ligase (exosortase A-associated)
VAAELAARRLNPAAPPAAATDGAVLAVEWTPLYVGFLVYLFAMITFVLPGNVGMVMALLALPFQRDRLRLPALLWIFGAYLAWSAVGQMRSAYPELVAERLVDYGKLWLIALVAVNALRTRAQIRFFLVFALVSFALFPARGAIINYLGGYTVWGRALWNHIYANPNDLAALTLLQLAGASALLATDRARWIRLGALASVLVLSVLVLMTQSRGALIALVVFAGLALASQRRRPGALLLMGAVVAAAAVFAPAGVWQRASGLVHLTSTETLAEADEEGSARQRFVIWTVAASIIRDQPVTGVGLGAYPEAHERYAASEGVAWVAGGKRDTHSTFLNVAAETGYPGLLLFLGMLGAVVYAAERARRAVRRVDRAAADRIWLLEAGLMAYLAAGVFGSFAHLSHLYLFLALLTVVALEARGRAGPAAQPVRRHRVG